MHFPNLLLPYNTVILLTSTELPMEIGVKLVERCP